MLLFIRLAGGLASASLSFNTSHVTLYRWEDRVTPGKFKFQYISCYSLSKQTELASANETRFNTSHVTLYRNCCSRNREHCLSFNTSHVTLYLESRPDMNCCIVVSIHLMLLFINASAIPLPTVSSVSIHLMLLFIGKEMKALTVKECFNTSHVTLYQPDDYTALSQKHVSIHLMLLFIHGQGRKRR